FDAATIDRLLDNYRRLIEAALDDPRRSVSRLAIVGPDERRDLLERWCGVPPPYPRESLAALFEAHAAAAPDAIAIADGARAWTYAQLNRQANRDAHTLLRRDLGPRRIVAVCIDRSAESVAAILGIVKAGAAYLAIDPDTPEPRRHAMLRDADVRITLPIELDPRDEDPAAPAHPIA